MSSSVISKSRAFELKLSNARFIGRAQALISAMGFGAIATFAKFAYSEGIDSSMLLSLRFLVAAAALWAYFLIFNRGAIRIGRKELAITAALGLAGYGVFSNLVFRALETTPASITGLLFFSYPVFVMLIDWIVTKERPESQFAIGAAMILCGVTVGVLGTLAGGLTSGVLFAVGGAAWYAAYVAASRRLLCNVGPKTVALYVTTFAALGFWLMGGPGLPQIQMLTVKATVVVLAIGLVSTVVALLCFFSSLEKLGAAETSQLSTFELIVSLSLASVFLGEHIGIPLMAGAAFILVGIVTSQIKPSSRSETCPDDATC
ncbi:MAG TPA: DMT family transporter [Blastocatellia bacterium]|nr:DMT family transporter [Blastocatellia bacterium]